MLYLTALIFAFSCLAFAIGLNCTNPCCYYYSIVPKNVTTLSCNPEGMDINWVCWIHSPHENSTDFSVRWYKAALGTVESSDMAQGELISEMSGKYDFTITRQPFTANGSKLSGLFLHEFALTINNFSSSTDDGYYWCQIVVNDTCPLEPSPTGYAAFGQFPVERCKYDILDFIEHDMPPICAELGTLCNGETLSTTELNGEQVSTYTIPTHTLLNMSWTLTVILTGGLMFIIVLLLLIIVGCTVCNVRNRKMITAMRANKAKYHPGQSLNVYNDQPTKSDNEVFAMDAPGAKEKSDRKPDGRKQPILPPSKCAPQTIQEPTISTMHVSTDEVKYAQPGAMHRPPLIPQEVSSPSQYQGLRASGVDAIAAYNIPHVRRHEYSGGEVKANLKYANLPM